MIVKVFDNGMSIVHVIVGLIPAFKLPIFLGFLAYELIEFMRLYRRREGVKEFIGDLLEYALGRCFGSLIMEAITWP